MTITNIQDYKEDKLEKARNKPHYCEECGERMQRIVSHSGPEEECPDFMCLFCMKTVKLVY